MAPWKLFALLTLIRFIVPHQVQVLLTGIKHWWLKAGNKVSKPREVLRALEPESFSRLRDACMPPVVLRVLQVPLSHPSTSSTQTTYRCDSASASQVAFE